MPRAVTTTSPTATDSSWSTISRKVLPATGTVCGTMPMNDTESAASLPETLSENLPFESVVVPRVVPSCTTAAPTTGCFCSLVTVPRTVTLCCANAEHQQQTDSNVAANSRTTPLLFCFWDSFSILSIIWLVNIHR